MTTSVAEMTQFNSYKSLDNNIYHQYISLELTVQKIFVTDELHHLNPITPPPTDGAHEDKRPCT